MSVGMLILDSVFNLAVLFCSVPLQLVNLKNE